MLLITSRVALHFSSRMSSTLPWSPENGRLTSSAFCPVSHIFSTSFFRYELCSASSLMERSVECATSKSEIAVAAEKSRLQQFRPDRRSFSVRSMSELERDPSKSDDERVSSMLVKKVDDVGVVVG